MMGFYGEYIEIAIDGYGLLIKNKRKIRFKGKEDSLLKFV